MSWLPDYETLRARYAAGYTAPHASETTRLEWPRPLEHTDLDPLLRAALRAEAERKATAAAVSKSMGRIIRRTEAGR